MKFFKKVLNKIDKELMNVILLGLVFMLLYSAFYTLSNLEKLILNSVKIENSEYNGSAFVSLTIWYITFALFLWIVPPLIHYTGLKLALTIGAVGYSLFIASFLPENAWVLYSGSLFNGFGAAMLYTSQTCYTILNSLPTTITRNAAIFSCFNHSSLLYGNLFVYFTFTTMTEIDHGTRTLVISVLLGLSVLGVLVALALPPPAYKEKRDIPFTTVSKVVKATWNILHYKELLILCPMFVYCGLQASFFSGIFGAAVGFTTYSDGFSSAELVPITGLSTGLGAIFGEVCLILMNPILSSRPKTRSIVVIVTLCSEYIAFLFTFLNFSNDSIFSSTNEPTIISSRSWLAVIIAVLLGFSDGIFQPMLISLVGKIYPSGNASIITLPTFCFSFASAVGFFYSSYIGLHWQLLILVFVGAIGVTCFCQVNNNIDWKKPSF